jgi:hypothetical protein
MTPEGRATSEGRSAEIQRTLEAIQNGWPFFMALLNARISALTEALINNDNEQTRGAIKELRRFRDMPEALKQEREGISADLSEQDSAD